MYKQTPFKKLQLQQQQQQHQHRQQKQQQQQQKQKQQQSKQKQKIHIIQTPPTTIMNWTRFKIPCHIPSQGKPCQLFMFVSARAK